MSYKRRVGPVEELLSDPKRWTKNVLARDSEGKGCQYDRPYAVQWCIAGAMMLHYPDVAVCDDESVRPFCVVNGIEPMYSGKYWMALVLWNNDPKRTHEQLLTAVRKAGI